jgi:hypothetical protein
LPAIAADAGHRSTPLALVVDANGRVLFLIPPGVPPHLLNLERGWSRDTLGAPGELAGPTYNHGSLAEDADGTIAFIYSRRPGWEAVSADGEIVRGSYIEAAPRPEVVVERSSNFSRTRLVGAWPNARRGFIAGTHLYVLFVGRTDDALKGLDVYDLRTGSYVTSLRLPVRVRNLSFFDGVLYLLHEDPYPRITAVRPDCRPEASHAFVAVGLCADSGDTR